MPHPVRSCRMPYAAKGEGGFTLLELSVTILIIGLLIGGIMLGKNIVRNAQIRTIGSEYTDILSATQSFRDKFNALPGDFAGATGFWGDNNVSCPDPSTPDGTPGTCNGNDDRKITRAGGQGGSTGEMFQFWVQLVYAKMYEGRFTGGAAAWGNGGGNESTELGVNAPASRSTRGGWQVGSGDPTSSPAYTLPKGYGNYLIFGDQFFNEMPAQPILRTGEAYALDSKFDDGKPASGKVIGGPWNDSCAKADNGNSSASNLEASYNVGLEGIFCVLYFPSAF